MRVSERRGGGGVKRGREGGRVRDTGRNEGRVCVRERKREIRET